MNPEYTIQAIQEGKRLDGRDLFQIRDITCLFGPPETGSVELQWGETRIFAQTNATIVTPHVARPQEGYLKFHIDLSILRDTLGINPQKQSMEIEKFIDRVIKGSKALDTESLCIKSGKSVWSIDVQVILINNDGNLIDTCYLCSLLSLLHFRKPQISGVDIDYTKRFVPLSIHHIPLSFTFSLIEKDQTYITLDPSIEEDNVKSGRLTICVNVYNDICHIHKPGGCPIQTKTFDGLIKVTLSLVKPFTEKIRLFLKNMDNFTKTQEKIVLYQFERIKPDEIQ
ncbi:hypothetical protein pb186bvf_017358 [Paramecium bursaria]